MSTAFRITLTGGQQVPAVVTSASGLGTAIFDSSNTTLQYVINVQGIDVGPFVGQPAQTASTADDVAGMHFHNGAAGANGPIVFDWASQDKDDLNVTLQSDGSWNVRGMWELTDPASTSLSSFAAMLGSAAVGSAVDLYANFHTNTNAGGEIRGQLIAIADDNANVVAGTAGNDFLPGLGGDDNMTGGDGNDILDGGTGNDIMAGGMGNDVYVVDSVGDVVNELPGQGTDEIQTALSVILAGCVAERREPDAVPPRPISSCSATRATMRSMTERATISSTETMVAT